MKVTFLNTFEQHGGAGLAGHRIFSALKKHSPAELIYLSQFRGVFRKNRLIHTAPLIRVALEKLWLRKQLRDKSDLYKFETGVLGKGFRNNGYILSSDVIHLHWINQGFISIGTLQYLAGLKPLVWTMHDMWPFTGGCSYANECTKYLSHCGDCPYLKFPHPDDLSNRIWKKKSDIYKTGKLTLVGPSKWITAKAEESTLGKMANVVHIFNPIDTDFFAPGNRNQAREKMGIDPDKTVFLFGAQNIDDERKGFSILSECLEVLHADHPDVAGKAELLIFGRTKYSEKFRQLPVRVRYAGIVNDQIVLRSLYHASDWYVHTARADNLPNTVVEAAACGVPVIGFDTGGVKEIIQDGISGMLSRTGDMNDFVKSVFNAVFQKDSDRKFGKNAREFAVQQFSMEKVAGEYMKVYEDLKSPRPK